MKLGDIREYAQKVGYELKHVVNALKRLQTENPELGATCSPTDDQRLHLSYGTVVDELDVAVTTFEAGELYRDSNQPHSTPPLDRAYVLQLLGRAETIIKTYSFTIVRHVPFMRSPN